VTNDIYNAKFYAQQCEAWMRICNNNDCPMRVVFEVLIALHRENLRLEYHLKHKREFPDEN
jgi:hypothetical protein